MPRNSQGQYFLPDGNPVVAGSLIESDWANKTMEDLGQAISDSLDRDGQGGMRAPLRGTAGSASSPAFSFVNDSRTGLFLSDQGVVSAVSNGIEQAYWSVNGLFAPATPVADQQVSNKKYVDDSVSAKGIIGEIRMFAGTQYLPTGWHVCDGNNGTIDLRDRFILGGGGGNAYNSKGGSTTITVDQMPPHNHGGQVQGTTAGENQGHTHQVEGTTVGQSNDHTHYFVTSTSGNHSHYIGLHDANPNNPGTAFSTTYYPRGEQSASQPTDTQGLHNHDGTTGGASSNHTHNFSTTSYANNVSHTHAFNAGIPSQGGGQGYMPPFYAIVFAQYTGV